MTAEKVSERKTSDYIKSKIKGMLIPYFLFGGDEILYSIAGHNNWIGLVYPNSVCITLNGALWFLPALFLSDIIGFLALKYFERKLACFLLAGLAIIGNLHFVSLPFSADTALVGCGFLLIGFLIRKYGMKLLNLKLPMSIALTFIGSVLILLNGYVNMRTNKYSSVIPLFWINAIIMTVALWNTCRWIDERIDFRILKEIGSESLIYVCTNQAILILLQKIPIQLSNRLELLAYHAVAVFIIMAIGFILNRVIRKTPLKIALGK